MSDDSKNLLDQMLEETSQQEKKTSRNLMTAALVHAAIRTKVQMPGDRDVPVTLMPIARSDLVAAECVDRAERELNMPGIRPGEWMPPRGGVG